MRLKTSHLNLYRLAYLALFLCVWNLGSGILEQAHQGGHEAVKIEFALGQDDSQIPCSKDCDDESCPDHHCHFGHCHVLGIATLQVASPLFFSWKKSSDSQEIHSQIFDLLPKPPKA